VLIRQSTCIRLPFANRYGIADIGIIRFIRWIHWRSFARRDGKSRLLCHSLEEFLMLVKTNGKVALSLSDQGQGLHARVEQLASAAVFGYWPPKWVSAGRGGMAGR
jgi:hypothetical protein